MFMQSGKVKEGANEKYNEHYGYWWCAYNAMQSYLKSGSIKLKVMRMQDEVHPMMLVGIGDGRRNMVGVLLTE